MQTATTISPVRRLYERADVLRLKRVSPYDTPHYFLFAFVADMLIIFGATLVSQAISPNSTAQMSVLLLVLSAIIWVVLMPIMSLYDVRSYRRFIFHIRRLLQVAGLTALLVAACLYFAEYPISRMMLIAYLFTSTSTMIFWRTALHLRYRYVQQKTPARAARVLIVGTNDYARQVAGIISQSDPDEVVIGGFISDPDGPDVLPDYPVLGTLESSALVHVLKSQTFDEIIVAVPSFDAEKLDQLVLTLRSFPVNVRIVSTWMIPRFQHPSVSRLGNMWVFTVDEHPVMTPRQRYGKRVFDLFVASLAILLVLPVMTLVAVAIKLYDGGAVLFRQQRIGENGRLFTMYKFRSMVVNAHEIQHEVNAVDADGKTVYKQRNDPRITPIGRFIRRTSLDELPQLFNVVLGDMSLVGPRPELPGIVEEQYEPWQRQRFVVPQGITGWWQINGRAEKECYKATGEDLYYIENYSLWFDIEIMLRTIPAILRGEGAF